MEIRSEAERKEAIARINELRDAVPGTDEALELIHLSAAVQRYERTMGDARYAQIPEHIDAIVAIADRMHEIGQSILTCARRADARTMAPVRQHVLLGLCNMALHSACAVIVLCREDLGGEALGPMRRLLDVVVNLKLVTRGDAAANDEAARRYHHVCNREQGRVWSEGAKIDYLRDVASEIGAHGHRVVAAIAAEDLGVEGQRELWNARHWSVGSAKEDDASVYHRVGMADAHAVEYRMASTHLHAKDYQRYVPNGIERPLSETLTSIGSAVVHLRQALMIVAAAFSVKAPDDLDRLYTLALQRLQ